MNKTPVYLILIITLKLVLTEQPAEKSEKLHASVDKKADQQLSYNFNTKEQAELYISVNDFLSI